MSEPTSFWKRLLADLKRRHVVRVAIGYVIAAWALVEVCSILLPTFSAPQWVMRAVIAAAFLGFPVTIILAWVFDISGHGVVVTRARGIRIPKKVKAIVAVPLLGLVGIMGWWVWSGYVEDAASRLRPTELGDKVPIVAVMPIRNVTGDPEIDWYGQGLANLIRDNLTRSKFLRVVSPTRLSAIVGDAADEVEIVRRAESEGIGFVLSGEMLRTPDGITVSTRLTDTEGGVELSSRQVEGLTTETLLTAASPIATQVKQGLKVPREEQVDIFAADFATSNLSAYESYVAGLEYFLDYDYQQAEQAFNAALQLAPDFAVARYRLAYIQAVTGRTEPAIANMEQALESEYLPDRERRYIEAAHALFKRDYDAATQQYESLLEQYPFEIEARELLAKSYWGQYRAADAVNELELLAEQEPQNKVIWNALGWYLLNMGEFERAQPALERFAALAPDDPGSYLLLGDSMRYQGDLAGARLEYAKARELDPDLREVAYNLAVIAYMEGDHDSAVEQFLAIVDNESLNVRDRLDALFPLVSLTAARGAYADAIGLLDQFSDSLKEEQIRLAMATSMKALFQLELGNRAAAMELADSAIHLSPGVPTRYLFARGLVELESGEYAKVAQTAAELVSHALPSDNPDRTEEKAASFLEGMSLMAQGSLDASSEKLELATTLEGYDYRIYELGRARALYLQGQAAEGLALVEASVGPDPAEPRIDFEPDRVMAILLEAEILRNSGEAEKAKAAATAFLDRFNEAPPSHPAVILAREIAGSADAVAAAKNEGGPWAALSIAE